MVVCGCNAKCHHDREMGEREMMTEWGLFTPPPCFALILWFASIDARNLQEPQTRNLILRIRIRHGRTQKHEYRRDRMASSTNTTTTRRKLYITKLITPTIILKYSTVNRIANVEHH